MFNTLLVLGIASLVNHINLVSKLMFVYCAFFILVCLTMVAFTMGKQEISRTEGLTLISIYIAFVIYRK